MNRRTGFGLSMLVVSFWLFQTGLIESGIASLLMHALALSLSCFAASIITGVYEPENIPDEAMSPLASRVALAAAALSVVIFLLLVLLPRV